MNQWCYLGCNRSSILSNARENDLILISTYIIKCILISAYIIKCILIKPNRFSS